MRDHELRAWLADRLKVRLGRLGMNEALLTDDLDLVRNGVLDSLGFVDLIADLETATGKQVDLGRALEQPGATQVGSILQLFAE